MKPEPQTIAQLRKNKAYKFVTEHSIQVYPGWGARYVFKCLADESYWAANVYMSDDESDGEAVKEWFRVYPKEHVEYVSHDELPEVIEKRHRDYEEKRAAEQAKWEAENTPEKKRERSAKSRAKLLAKRKS